MVLLCFLSLQKAVACDICGCGAGNLYFGILPLSEKHMVGLRYRTLPFQSHLYPNDPYADLFKTKETFQVVDLMAKVRIGNKWQVATFLPYAFAKQTRLNQTFRTNGLADALILGQYRLIHTETVHPDWDWKQQLFVGLGVKLPTGKWKYGAEADGSVENANFQPGTGSTDGLGTLQHLIRYKAVGIQTDVQFRWNGENAQYYRFGNRLTGNSNVFYLKNVKNKVSAMAFAGAFFDVSRKNVDKGYEVFETGGTLTMLNLGLQVFVKKVSGLVQYQTTLQQNLSEGHLKAEDRWMVQVGYGF